MRQNLKGFDLLRDIGKAMAPLFLVLWACGMVLFFTLESVSPPGRRTPIAPEFAFDNVGPCLGLSRDLVERFEVGDKQYICAEMKTNEPAVYLELRVFTGDKKRQVYVDGDTFAPGSISFTINPPLPPGKYWAKITWSRPALVDFEFEVVEESK